MLPGWSERKTHSQTHTRLLVTSEAHFTIAGTDAIYSRGPATYVDWSRYLEVFDEVLVVARAGQGGPSEIEAQRADGPRVTFRALPDYTGPWEYLRVCRAVQEIVRKSVKDCNAYLLRVPGIVSQMVWHEIVRSNKPYALEVLGDPWDALSPGSWTNVTRPLFRLTATRQMKRICAGASALHYVTVVALQKRYPHSKDAYAAAFSDVVLDQALVSAKDLSARRDRLSEMPWQNLKGENRLRIGFMGSFARRYKGADVLLRAAALCKRRGLNYSLNIAGDGYHLAEMKALAEQIGIAGHTKYLGHLDSRQRVFDFLDATDLFVMPSRAEGMPRALIEAMARGCPCIGSDVGGIPELLHVRELVPAGNPELLAESILHIAFQPSALIDMSARNWAKAHEFSPDKLCRLRHNFLQAVKHRSQLL